MSDRLLVVTPDYPPFRGGIQHLLQRVVEGMDGFTTTVVTRDERAAREWDAERPYRVVRLGDRSRRLGSLGPNAAALREGCRTRPNIVLAGHLLAAPSALALRIMRRAPFALYLYADELPGHRGLLIEAMRRAAVTIAISEHTKSLAATLGAPTDRCILIPPGVDIPLPLHEEARVPGLIVTVARLSDRYKGHDVLMAAMPIVRSSVPDAHWVVVGDGPLRHELEERARKFGLGPDAVRFIGSVDDKERDMWLARASVFCMPSRLPPSGLGGEGFGIVFLEAGSHGTPVVAGEIGGALDAVEDGKTGLLVDPERPEAVAGAITNILMNPSRAAALGDAGRRNALAHSWPNIARQVQAALLSAARL